MLYIYEYMEVRWCKFCCNIIEDYLWVCGDVNVLFCIVVNELYKVVILNR